MVSRFLDKRFEHTVIDAETGEKLEGVPSSLLFAASSVEDATTMHARFCDYEWVYVASVPNHLEWHRKMGHNVRLVRLEKKS